MSNTFTPIGGTRAVSATTTSANITIATTGTNAFQVDASGAAIFVAVGNGVATHPATDGTVGNGVIVPTNQTKTLQYNNLGSSTNANVVISVITQAGSGTLYITPGVI